MPTFRNKVLDALVEPVDLTRKGAVESFVNASLRDLPHHLKLGIFADSILLETLSRATHGGRVPQGEELRDLIEKWEAHPFTPIRQYARLMTSLVLFADQELRPSEEAVS